MLLSGEIRLRGSSAYLNGWHGSDDVQHWRKVLCHSLLKPARLRLSRLAEWAIHKGLHKACPALQAVQKPSLYDFEVIVAASQIEWMLSLSRPVPLLHQQHPLQWACMHSQ